LIYSTGLQCDGGKRAGPLRLKCDGRKRRVGRISRLRRGILHNDRRLKSGRRDGAITGPLQHGGVHLRRLAVSRGCRAGVAGRIRGVLAVACSGRLLHQGIGKKTAGGVNDSPLVLAGVRIDIAAAQKTLLAFLQIVDAGGPLPVVGQVIQLNGARVLLAAIDQELLFFPLAFERYARQLLIQHQRDDGGHQEHH